MDTYGAAIEGGLDHSEDPSAPKAFLNILLFDKNHYLVDAAYRQIDVGAIQPTSVPMVKAPHDYLVREVTVTEPGYAYIFFSNEEDVFKVDVHFDDVTITHTHSNIVAGADYYPFGLVMDGREIDDEAYRWGYQGQFSEKNDSTGWNEFDLRMYDARIGRWLSPDPYGQFASPYLAMGNIPHLGTDPDGGLCCGGVWNEALGAYLLPEIVGATATRISGVAIASTIGQVILRDGLKTWTSRGIVIEPMKTINLPSVEISSTIPANSNLSQLPRPSTSALMGGLNITPPWDIGEPNSYLGFWPRSCSGIFCGKLLDRCCIYCTCNL